MFFVAFRGSTKHRSENEIQKVESELDDINNSLDMVTDNTNNIFGEIKVVDTKRRNIIKQFILDDIENFEKNLRKSKNVNSNHRKHIRQL